MKKFRSFISIFLACCLLMSTVGTSASSFVYGDFNHDGSVTSADAIYLLKYTIDNQNYPLIYGDVEVAESNYSYGDLNRDGVITSSDAIYLLKNTIDNKNYPLIYGDVDETAEPTAEPTATQAPTVDIESAEVGNIVKLGSYEQDNNADNGTEDIEWLVLAKEESRILVISRYGLDAKAYHETSKYVTWENCTLRTWLNETFLTSAFSMDEQKMIQTTNVVNDDNSKYGIDGGNDTQDKIFLLSISEAEQYFSYDELRRCVPTDYAKASGCVTDSYCQVDGNDTCWWWLRTPGCDYSAASVRPDGSVFEYGNYVQYAEDAVRPAMWISIKTEYSEPTIEPTAIPTEDPTPGPTNACETVNVGDVITLGSYEQDNDTTNGTEDIDWLVLAKEESRMLVISKYALLSKEYNSSHTSVTWEDCTLRTWLNDTFLTSAFSSEDQKTIQTTAVVNDDNQENGTDGGNDTQDKIFLLSISEVNQYFTSDVLRRCVPTDYAKANGCYTYSRYQVNGNATCWWWLRSPGEDAGSAASVYYDGSVDECGDLVNYAYVAVRPAMWISLES